MRFEHSAMRSGDQARGPDWYPAPAGQPTERWWTGAQRSGRRRPAGTSRATGRGSSGTVPMPWLVGAAALATVRGFEIRHHWTCEAPTTSWNGGGATQP